MIETTPAERISDLIDLLAVTPGPTGGEGPRMARLERWLAERGVPAGLDDAGNLWVDLSGDADWSDCVVLDAHVDVVGRGVADQVISRDGKLIGAGVADNLAAVAMLAEYCRLAAEAGVAPSRPLKIVFTVGEEGLGNLRGVRQIVDDHPTGPYLYLALDGGYHRCHVAALGSNRYELTVSGPGGHSWGAYGAPSATAILVDLLEALKAAHAAQSARSDRLVSYNIGSLAGGEGINCIARDAKATFEFRSADPTALSRMDRAAHKALQDAGRFASVRVNLTSIGRRPAAQPYGAQAAERLVRAIWASRGVKLETTVASTNINIPLARGWPSLCVGVCLGGNGHREDEYVLIDSLETGWGLLNELIARLDEL